MNVQKILMSKKGLVIGAAAVILGLGIFAIKHEYMPQREAENTEDTEVVVVDYASTTESVSTTTTSTAVSAPLSYARALQVYRDKKIQFAPNCQAYPNTVTYKNNTAIMLDNRSPSAQTVEFGGKTYVLPAYGFKIATVYSSKAPTTMLVECGGMRNIVTMSVQK